MRFWFDEKATQHWYNECAHGGRGLSTHFSDLAIETCLTLRPCSAYRSEHFKALHRQFCR